MRATLAILAAAAACAAPCRAQFLPDATWFDGPGHWRVAFSPVTQHWRPSPEHRHVWALGAERWGDNGRLWGASYFTNSFGQPSAYAFVGTRYPGILGQPSLYAQWTAGVLYGYKGAYKNKVPLNYGGFSPGAVLSLGFEATPQTAFQYNLLGDAAVMFQISHRWR